MSDTTITDPGVTEPDPDDGATLDEATDGTTLVDEVIPTATDGSRSDDGLDHLGLAHHTSTGLSNTKLGMWLFLGSECLMFGGLIATYMLYRNRQGDAIGPDQLWDIPFTSASSFCLLMSSLTMVLAVSAAKRHDDRNTRLWLITTASLGGLFVAGQVYEFTTFYREGLGFTTSGVVGTGNFRLPSPSFTYTNTFCRALPLPTTTVCVFPPP